MRLYSLFAAITLTLFLSACAAIQPAAQPASEETVAESSSGSAAAHEAHGEVMVDDVPFDAQFIDSMIVHHQSAIDMAQVALEQSEREEIPPLAEAIIAAQEAEIERMQSWRDAWYPDLPPTSGMHMDMGEMEISEDESKPFDQRFIEAMISHHQGAVDMAKMVLEQAEHEELHVLAEAIITAQEAEIEQMQQWLEDWFADGATSNVVPSPYASQLAASVRGLTAEEVEELLDGRGMGFARMAELNNYPGPRHLLDLQAELSLTLEQVKQIGLVFQAMQTDAQALGREIVLQEQVLSDAFAAGTIDSAALRAQVRRLGEDYGQLRYIHLQAHVEVTPLLTAEQVARYNELRGYTDNAQRGHHH